MHCGHECVNALYEADNFLNQPRALRNDDGIIARFHGCNELSGELEHVMGITHGRGQWAGNAAFLRRRDRNSQLGKSNVRLPGSELALNRRDGICNLEKNSLYGIESWITHAGCLSLTRSTSSCRLSHAVA